MRYNTVAIALSLDIFAHDDIPNAVALSADVHATHFNILQYTNVMRKTHRVHLTNQSALGKPRVQVRTFCSLITATLVLNAIVVFDFVFRAQMRAF